MEHNIPSIIFWTILTLAGLGAGIVHWIRLTKDTTTDWYKEMEDKKKPLSKLEQKEKELKK